MSDTTRQGDETDLAARIFNENLENWCEWHAIAGSRWDDWLYYRKLALKRAKLHLRRRGRK